jgi:preprotein translocase SecE subunit
MGIKNYINDTRGEFKYVKWLTRSQVIQYTILVISVSVIASVFLALCDVGFIKLMSSILVK